MPIVDSHCHVSPVLVRAGGEFILQMERNGVDRAMPDPDAEPVRQRLPVRMRPAVSRRRFAPVVVIDSAHPDAPQELARQAALGASGVRFQPTVRSAAADPLLLWRTAARLGLAIGCIGTSAYFASDDFQR